MILGYHMMLGPIEILIVAGVGLVGGVVLRLVKQLDRGSRGNAET